MHTRVWPSNNLYSASAKNEVISEYFSQKSYGFLSAPHLVNTMKKLQQAHCGTVYAENDSPRRTLVKANKQLAQILALMLSDPVGAAVVDWHNLTLMCRPHEQKTIENACTLSYTGQRGIQQLGGISHSLFGTAHTPASSYFPETGRDDQADVGRVRLTIDTRPVELT
jgi:hypothetical protein